ncbi:histidine kinase [Streptomyces sp. NPDC050610]|uniref:sensor histidine kinase n=1 Tax=Streptomyces sp. NPDC050610 TaxID=3157097 RepID=UPI0034307894
MRLVKHGGSLAEGLRRAPRRLAEAFRRLFAPGMWSFGRIVGETLLSVVLGLTALTLEDTAGETPRTIAVAVAVALLSPLRRVLPATVLLLAAIGSPEISGLLPLAPVAAWSAGKRIAGHGRATVVFAVAYVLSVAASLVQDLPRVLPSSVVFGSLLMLALILLPGLISRYSSQRHTLLDTLRDYNAQLLREREMVAGQARLRERQRIAQDMHDSLGHQLALISVHTGALEVDSELTGRQREAVGVLREASVTAMRELREVVGLLRDGTQVPGPPQDAGPAAGVADGVEDLARASRAAGTSVEVRRVGEPRPLTPAADHAAYRIAQEGLTNAHKHAPGAPIELALHYDADSLVVEVVNGPPPAGAGRAAISGGQGLTGLGERTRLVGGMVHAGPTADGGFRLAGVLPYGPAAPDAPAPRPTTIVDAADDLRRLPRTGSHGDSDPVIEGNGLPKELARAVNRNKRRGGWALGCGLTALIVVAAVVFGGIKLFQHVQRSTIEPEQYDEIEVGQSEASVRDQLPDGKSFLTQGLRKGAPPKPAGAECLSLLSMEDAKNSDNDIVYRFCFKGGRLVEKKTFEVKS